MNPEINNLLSAFWHDFDRPDVWWQVIVLLLCLGFAKVAEKLISASKLSDDQAARRHWRLGHGGLRRLSFPLIGMGLVFGTRIFLREWHPVNLLSIAIPLLLSLAIIRLVFYVLRYSFNPSGWLASFERTVALLVWAVVALHIAGLLPQLIDLLEAVSFPVGKQKLNLWLVAQGLFVVVVTMLIALWLSGLADAKLAAARGLDGNLRVVFSRLTKAVLIVLAVMIGLPLVGIDLTTLSIFGGALGVGLGFGLQKIASNYVSGFIILLDRSIQLGNVIAVGGERGQVTRITTRYTVLKNVTGVEAIVPNEVLVSSVVLNESLNDPRVRIAIKVLVSYDSEVELAMKLMEQAAGSQPRILAEPAPQASIVDFADNGIALELGCWIADPQEGTTALRSDVNLAFWKAFKGAGIEIPGPQRNVRIFAAESGKSVELKS